MKPRYIAGLVVLVVAVQLLAFNYGNAPKALVDVAPDGARNMCLQIAKELQRSSSNWRLSVGSWRWYPPC